MSFEFVPDIKDNAEKLKEKISKALAGVTNCNPARVTFGADKVDIIDIAVVSTCCFALSSDGVLYGWGRSQLLHPKNEIPQPVVISSLSDLKISRFSFSNSYGLLLSRDNNLYEWSGASPVLVQPCNEVINIRSGLNKAYLAIGTHLNEDLEIKQD